MVRIKIENIGKVYKDIQHLSKYIESMPDRLDENISGSNKSFMLRVRKGARLRAPKDTGALKNSIRLKSVKGGKRIKKWAVVAGGKDASHAIFQETGYKAHVAPIMNSAKFAPGVYKLPAAKGRFFMRDAVEQQLSAFSQNLKGVVDKATQ